MSTLKTVVLSCNTASTPNSWAVYKRATPCSPVQEKARLESPPPPPETLLVLPEKVPYIPSPPPLSLSLSSPFPSPRENFPSGGGMVCAPAGNHPEPGGWQDVRRGEELSPGNFCRVTEKAPELSLLSLPFFWPLLRIQHGVDPCCPKATNVLSICHFCKWERELKGGGGWIFPPHGEAVCVAHGQFVENGTAMWLAVTPVQWFVLTGDGNSSGACMALDKFGSTYQQGYRLEFSSFSPPTSVMYVYP